MHFALPSLAIIAILVPVLLSGIVRTPQVWHQAEASPNPIHKWHWRLHPAILSVWGAIAVLLNYYFPWKEHYINTIILGGILLYALYQLYYALRVFLYGQLLRIQRNRMGE